MTFSLYVIIPTFMPEINVNIIADSCIKTNY